MRDSEPAGFWPAICADFSRFREEGQGLRPLIRGLLSQGFQALLIYRVFRWFYEHGIPTQPLRFMFERFIEITTGISIPAEAAIGKGLRIHHFGGIIIHPEAVVGEECTLYHGVTIGDLAVRRGAPHVGNRVLIGAGAKVIGAIRIGDDTLIGANAVVVSSVPSGYVAVGIPAVARPRDKRQQVNSQSSSTKLASSQELQ
jgi:serine O-acetyltransferase